MSCVVPPVERSCFQNQRQCSKRRRTLESTESANSHTSAVSCCSVCSWSENISGGGSCCQASSTDKPAGSASTVVKEPAAGANLRSDEPVGSHGHQKVSPQRRFCLDESRQAQPLPAGEADSAVFCSDVRVGLRSHSGGSRPRQGFLPAPLPDAKRLLFPTSSWSCSRKQSSRGAGLFYFLFTPDCVKTGVQASFLLLGKV